MADRFHTHGLGQVFLISQRWINRIVKAAYIKPGDNIIEIGPGKGALTRRLLSEIDRYKNNLYLIEKDPELIKPLVDMCPPSVVIKHMDFMDFNLQKTPDQSFTIISNLPYSSSTQILIRLLRNHSVIERMVLMFQREVASRILARPKTRKFGRLAAMTQAFWKVRSLGVVPQSCFRPIPAVLSEVVVFEERMNFDLPDFDVYEAMVAAIFAHPRRTIENSLAIALKRDKSEMQKKLQNAGIDPKNRPSDLSIEQVLALVAQLII